MSFIQWWCERGAKSHVAKEVSGLKKRTKKKPAWRKGQSRGWRFSFYKYFTVFFYLLLLFYYFFYTFFTHDIYPHLAHTHTRDPHSRPTTSPHYPRPTTSPHYPRPTTSPQVPTTHDIQLHCYMMGSLRECIHQVLTIIWLWNFRWLDRLLPSTI